MFFNGSYKLCLQYTVYSIQFTVFIVQATLLICGLAICRLTILSNSFNLQFIHLKTPNFLGML